jgi:hypothetical protein
LYVLCCLPQAVFALSAGWRALLALRNTHAAHLASFSWHPHYPIL